MSSELDATTMDASAPRAKAPLEPMIHLIWSAGRLRSDHLRDLPPELVLGRAPGEGGLALPEDHQASRRHARFLRRGRDVSVEDLGSRNGTFVNGERVSRTPLVDRDVVRIGSTLLVFRLEDPRQLDVPNELLVGRSQEIRQVRIAVQRYAKSSDTVLVVGETGTGKELVAQALHRVGKRPGELVAVNCAAIQAALAESVLFGHVAGAFTGARGDAEGFFRAAGRGTLLLDEVGDMAPSLQPKLLRALETQAVVPVGATKPIAHEARIVAATNVDLPTAVQEGRFRDDLLARLAQLRIELPPLRDRREDILLLLDGFLGAGQPELAPSLAEALVQHPYPRNVRELAAIAAALRALGPEVARFELDHLGDRLSLDEPEDTPRATTSPPDRTPSQPPPDTEELRRLLTLHQGNVTAVARAVGRSRTQTYRLIEQSGLDPTHFR